MKTLIKLVVVLLVVVVGLVVAVGYYIDTIARKAVEQGGTYAMGVTTTLGSADVRVLAGEFAMSDLLVANPAGFDSPHFLRLGGGEVAVSLASLREDTVRLPHLNLNDIDMSLESKDGKANYQVIMDNLKRLSSGESKPKEEGKKFVIEAVNIRNVNVHAKMPGKSVDVPIEQITLKNVGSEGAGVNMSELMGVVVKSVLAAVVQNGGGRISPEMLGDLATGLAGLADLDKLAGKAGEEAARAVKDLGDDLGGILGGKDEGNDKGKDRGRDKGRDKGKD